MACRAQWPDAVILVSMHWGDEYVTDAPAPHQELARKLIDAGANGVLGHHPHVLQPVEVYKGSPILYSMGNLVFDQRRRSTRRSALFSLLWKKGEQGEWGLDEISIIPVMLQGGDTGPRLADSEESETILKALQQGSAKQNTALERQGDRLLWSARSGTAD